MSLIEFKRKKTSMVYVTVDKKSEDATIGLTLNYYDGGKILVRNISEEGLFANTELQAGMLLLTVNETDTKGLSTIQCMELLKEAKGEVTVVGQSVGLYVSVVTKDDPDKKVGIGLKDRDGMVIVSSINEEGLFGDTPMKIGQCLVSVNGTSCKGLNKSQAIILFKELQELTVMTEDVGIIAAKVIKPSKDASVGIGLRSLQGNIIISSIADSSLFKDTKLKPGLRLLTVNKTDCQNIPRMRAIAPFKEAEGAVTVLADDVGYILAQINKESPDTKLGIGLKSVRGHIIISSINEEGLFADSGLMPGLRVVCIQNTLCNNISKTEAIKILKEAEGRVVVVAERVGLITATGQKDTVDSKVGVGLKSVNGMIIISSIREGSIFEGTPLTVGLRVVSINNTNCVGLSKEDAIKALKAADGLVTIMAEEVGYITAAVEKEAEDTKVGIGLKEKNGEILISCVYDSGLFANSDVREDQRLVSVNDQKVKGMTRDQAIGLFREARGSIVVMTEDYNEGSLIM